MIWPFAKRRRSAADVAVEQQYAEATARLEEAKMLSAAAAQVKSDLQERVAHNNFAERFHTAMLRRSTP